MIRNSTLHFEQRKKMKYFTMRVMTWLDLYVHTLTELCLNSNPK